MKKCKTSFLKSIALFAVTLFIAITALELPALAETTDSSHTHTPGEWTTDTPASVHSAGSKQSVCTECGETINEIIPQLKCDTPANFKAENAANGVLLSWDAVEGADSYVIYKGIDMDDTLSKFKTSKTNSYLVKKSPSQSNFIDCYAVTAKNEAGESEMSDRSELRFIAPPKTKGIVATSTGVELSFYRIAAVKGYNIYRKAGSGEYKKIKSIKQNGNGLTTYTDTTAKSNTNYTYYITSYFNEIESAKGTLLSIKYISTPKLSGITRINDKVTLKWKKVTGAQGYYIYYRAPGSNYKKIKTIKGNSTFTFTNKIKKVNLDHSYYVVAYNGKAVSANSLTISSRFGAAPKVDVIYNGYDGLNLGWDKVTSADGYYVYRKLGSGTYKKIKTIKGAKHVSFIDTNAKSGKKYTYRVSAFRNDGLTTKKGTSDTILYLSYPEFKSATSTKQGIKLKWAKCDGAKIYYITRIDYTAHRTDYLNTKNSSQFIDKTVKKGHQYAYNIIAYNGKYYSERSWYVDTIKSKY